MTQRDLNRAVARATGESLLTIARLGFVPLGNTPVEREPLVVDWDSRDAGHVSYLPQRCRGPHRTA